MTDRRRTPLLPPGFRPEYVFVTLATCLSSAFAINGIAFTAESPPAVAMALGLAHLLNWCSVGLGCALFLWACWAWMADHI